MQDIYLFDVDGTLTPPCQEITPEFAQFFEAWAQGKNVVLVTGSDAEKTKRQLGSIWFRHIIYQCSGNQIYSHGIKVYETPILRDINLEEALRYTLESSRWEQPCGNHIEFRHGMINFSYVGRACTLEQRYQYYEWDKKEHQREQLAAWLRLQFPQYDIHIGGQISVDIYEKGHSKEQVVQCLMTNESRILFFGDKTQPGGNDYEISKHLPEDQVYTVSSYEETQRILERLKF